MNKYVKYVMQSLLLTMASLPAFAHQGHDHGHWTSSMMHVLFYGSILAAVAALTFAATKYTKSRKQGENQ